MNFEYHARSTVTRTISPTDSPPIVPYRHQPTETIAFWRGTIALSKAQPLIVALILKPRGWSFQTCCGSNGTSIASCLCPESNSAENRFFIIRLFAGSRKADQHNDRVVDSCRQQLPDLNFTTSSLRQASEGWA